MNLRAKDVFDLLEAKGVATLYHANSVLTSIHFLTHGALLARGVVEAMGLPQTSQPSDERDIEFGLWFDVFADTVDLHKAMNRRNFYGPVLFRLDVAQLRRAIGGEMAITASNPVHWNGPQDAPQRWFSSLEEAQEGFHAGVFRWMVVFRGSRGRVPLRRALTSVLLDDPACANRGTGLFVPALRALRQARDARGLQAVVKRRKCAPGCACKVNYFLAHKRTESLFRIA